jgi:adenylate kinase
MKIVFLGPPGAGKGTLAARAKDNLGVPHISTGNIFREAIAAGTPLGLKVKAVLDSGALVEDELTISLVKERLAQDDAQKGYILDGFPRTIPQAEALATFSQVDKVVNFDIPDANVIERLGGRRVCRKCGFNWHVKFNPTQDPNVCDKCGGEIYTREDDKPDAIYHRLEVYRAQTEPLIAFYRNKNLLVTIDARPEVGEILLDFMRVLGL